MNLCRGLIARSASVAALAAWCSPAAGEDVTPHAQRVLAQPTGEQRFLELTDAMHSLSEPDQVLLLRHVLHEATPGLACQVAGILITREGMTGEDIAALSVMVHEWEPLDQFMALSQIQTLAAPEQRRYAGALRTAYGIALQRHAATPEGGKNLDVIDLCALMIGRSGDPDAISDARAILGQVPASAGAWIVLLERGAVGASDRAIAQTIWSDEALELPVRVLAAIAMGPTSPEAAAFVSSTVQGLADEFGARTQEDIVLAGYRAPPGDPERASATRFISVAHPILSYMPLVSNGAADPVLCVCSNLTNELLRDTALYAIAKRSPALLLQEPACIESQEQLLRAAGAAFVWHPELQARFNQRFGEAQISGAVQAVTNASGTPILGLSGPPMLP